MYPPELRSRPPQGPHHDRSTLPSRRARSAAVKSPDAIQPPNRLNGVHVTLQVLNRSAEVNVKTSESASSRPPSRCNPSTAALPSLHHLHPSRDLLARHQRRPVRHDLPRAPAAALTESRRARRPVQHQRNQLAREAIHRFLIRPTNSDANLHLRRVRDFRRHRAPGTRSRRKTRIDLVELSARDPSAAAARCGPPPVPSPTPAATGTPACRSAFHPLM